MSERTEWRIVWSDGMITGDYSSDRYTPEQIAVMARPFRDITARIERRTVTTTEWETVE